MSLAIPAPQSVYRGNYASLPAATLKPPVEGNRTIPVSITWASAGLAPNYCIEFNARQQQTLAINQIAAIHVDNSKCSSSMHIGFLDTQFEILIGPNAVGFYPVVTNALEFFAWIDLNPGPTDVTILQVLNFLPPPILFGTQLGGTGVGTVREVDTAAPITGGPITDQGTIGLSVPLAVNFGGTGGATGNAGLDNLSGAAGATTGSLTRSGTGIWSVTAAGSGTITGVTAGNGLQGGGTSGTVALSINPPVSIANGGTAAITGNAALDNLSAQSGASAGLLQRSTGGSWATLAPLPLALGSGGTGASGGNAGLDSLSGTSGSTTGSLQRNASGVWAVSLALPANTTLSSAITLPAGSTANRNFAVQGVTDGSNAAAGNVGEYVTQSASSVTVPHNTTINVTQISLTAGDWDVEGFASLSGAAAGMAVCETAVSTTSATLPAAGTALNMIQFGIGTASPVYVINQPTGSLRLSITATTTVYLVCYVFCITSTQSATASATIRARRAR